jgi:dihydroxyacetone kinase-like predicted kinase
MVAAAHAAVKAQVARINDLNVYPVPDGDTGTNMLLTLGSVLNETAGKSYGSPEEASRACARAALMGARGNSGVILSQMIREEFSGRRGLRRRARRRKGAGLRFCPRPGRGHDAHRNQGCGPGRQRGR